MLSYIKLSITTVFICTSITAAAWAGDISLSASVDRNVIGLDEQAMLQVEVSGSASGIPDPQLPALQDFTAYSSGRSQNISIVNGHMSSSTSFRFVLAPRITGKFTIPPITIQHEGKTYQTQPIQIEVTNAGSSPVTSAPSSRGGAVSRQGADQKSIFITATVDKQQAYVNEQIAYTFRFYRRVRLLSNPQYAPPNFSGFWTEDTPPKNYNATLNGHQYLVTEVKTLLFPTRPNKFHLGNATLQCSVEDFNPADPASNDFFSNFFSGGRTQTLQSTPVSITVLPLPDAGKPNEFNGTVGRYNIKASIDKPRTAVNEPVTLTITVEGAGSIKTIAEPKLPEWTDFRKYETINTMNLSKEEGTLKGSKTFKTVLVPQTPGKKTIPAIPFVYFDPASKKYVTAMTGSLSLDVSPAAPGSVVPPAPAQGMSPSQPARGVKVENTDINYIKMPSRWAVYHGPLYRRMWFILINGIPLFLLGLLYAYLKWQERLTNDVAFARRLRASGVAKKYLRKARSLMHESTASEYYYALSRGLFEYIAHKFNLSPDGLTISAATELLTTKNVSQTTAARVKELLEQCDLVRFAPTTVTREMMGKSYSDMARLFGTLEKELK